MNESGIVWSYDKFKGFLISDYKWDIVGTYEVSRPYELYKHKKYSQQFMIYVEGNLFFKSYILYIDVLYLYAWHF